MSTSLSSTTTTSTSQFRKALTRLLDIADLPETPATLDWLVREQRFRAWDDLRLLASDDDLKENDDDTEDASYVGVFAHRVVRRKLWTLQRYISLGYTVEDHTTWQDVARLVQEEQGNHNHNNQPEPIPIMAHAIVEPQAEHYDAAAEAATHSSIHNDSLVPSTLDYKEKGRDVLSILALSAAQGNISSSNNNTNRDVLPSTLEYKDQGRDFNSICVGGDGSVLPSTLEYKDQEEIWNPFCRLCFQWQPIKVAPSTTKTKRTEPFKSQGHLRPHHPIHHLQGHLLVDGSVEETIKNESGSELSLWLSYWEVFSSESC